MSGAAPTWRPEFPFFHGQQNPWRTHVTEQTTLDPNSAVICAYLQQLVTSSPAGFVGSSQDVPIYVVGETQPFVPVKVKNSSQPYAKFISQAPIPAGAKASPGVDGYLIVVQYQPDGDAQMWEFWQAGQDASGNWSCTLGTLRRHVLTSNPGYSREVKDAAGNVLEQPNWGVAGSLLALAGGAIQVAEALNGAINHALSLQLPDTRKGQWAFPAQFTDGTDTNASSVPEGAHFRIDPTVNLMTLGLPHAVYVAAEAAQRYGMVVNDRTGVGGSVGFAYEDGAQYMALNGYSAWSNPPWSTPSTPWNAFKAFPWQHVQLLPMDLRTQPDNTLYVEAD